MLLLRQNVSPGGRYEIPIKAACHLRVTCVPGVLVIAAVLLLCAFDWPQWRGPNADGISKETDWYPKALKDGPKVLWERNIGIGYSDVAVKGNRLYAFGSSGAFKNIVSCLDTDTGGVIWQYTFESPFDPQSTPTVDGESVYVLAKNGTLLS